MYNSFIENKQIIQFGEDWGIIKLDEHRYYKRISGMGVKCVDFMALHADWGLFLIEIKDYTIYDDSELPSKEMLQNILASKKSGSIRLIKIVNQALQRKWYYRWIFQRLKWYKYCPREWIVWDNALTCVLENRITMIAEMKIE